MYEQNLTDENSDQKKKTKKRQVGEVFAMVHERIVQKIAV